MRTASPYGVDIYDNGLLAPGKIWTLATLPDAAKVPIRTQVYTSDGGLRISDGFAWRSDSADLNAQLQSPLLATQIYPPFKDNDSSLIVNLGPVITEAKATAAGFTATGGDFDSVLGYRPGAGGLIDKLGAATSMSGATWTIYFEVERAAISADKSISAGANFVNSTGRTTADGLGYIWSIHDDTPLDILRIGVNGADGSFNFSHIRNNGGIVNGVCMNSGNSYVHSAFDARFAKCFLTVSGTRWYVNIDGQYVGTGTFATEFPAGFVNLIRLGGYNSADSLGNYYLRRWQLSTRYCPPQEASARIGIIGDSIVVAGDGRADAAGDTVAQIDAVQSNLTPVASAARRTGLRGQTSWVHVLQALANDQLGCWLNVYNAGKSGAGWAINGSGVSPIPTAYFDALNAFAPEIVIALGSVNDPSNGTPSQIGLDCRARLDYVANNNPYLRTILFFETFSWEASSAGTVSGGPAAWKAKNQSLIADQRAKLESYLAGTRQVPVSYMRTYDAMYPGGTVSDATKRYFIGSHPDNTTTSRDGGASQDAHPSAEGHLYMGTTVIWPYLRNTLLSMPLRV